jgi:hypothetical protein
MRAGATVRWRRDKIVGGPVEDEEENSDKP